MNDNFLTIIRNLALSNMMTSNTCYLILDNYRLHKASKRKIYFNSKKTELIS